MIAKFFKCLVGCVVCVSLASKVFAEDITIHAQANGKPIVDAKLTLWHATANEEPRIVASGETDNDGKHSFNRDDNQDGFYYVTSKEGSVDGFQTTMLTLVSVINNEQSGDIYLNELTTIGSIWPLAAQYQDGHFKGTKTGLLVASEHVQNLVDVETGSFGATILNMGNLTFSETVGRMNTLAALLATCSHKAGRSSCEKFLDMTGSDTTSGAMVKVAKSPYLLPSELFQLFKTAYPYPKGEGRRSTAFLPYLEWEPKDFSLMVRFAGGGLYSAGRLMFDQRGQLWSGQNWMPGSQSNLTSAIGGGVIRMDSSGRAMSPSLVGYNDQGLDGTGWGTTVSETAVWVGTFNKLVGVFDLEGRALGPATVDGEIGGLQGLAVAPNGDVWVCDNQLNQMIRFPEGDYTAGEIVQVPGLKRPFAVAVDNENNVWVTNNGFVTVTKFSPEAPQNAEQIRLGGMAPRGLAIDSQGNVWVGNNFSMGYPLATVPKGVSIIEEFKLNILKVLDNEANGLDTTGNLTMIAADGTVLSPKLLEGEIYAGWGVSIDGQDNVFVGNFMGQGFMQVCGANIDACPEGKSTGDLIHYYESGILQHSTDTMVDDAGNVWVANNWDVRHALVDDDPDRRTATRGGGTGIVVIYGIASPVRNPLIGQVRRP